MTPTPPPPDSQAEGPPAPPAVERRRAERYSICRQCFASPAGPPAAGWRVIACDISATGVGLALPFPLQPGVELEVRPAVPPGARPLRACVVRTHPLEFAWLVGCELAEPLNEADLWDWLAGADPGRAPRPTSPPAPDRLSAQP